MSPASVNRAADLRLGLGLAAVVVILDQAIKAWMLGLVFDPPRVIEVTSFFNLAPVWNRGVSFGFLSGAGEWGPLLLTGVAALVVLFLLRWLSRAEDRFVVVALGLVLGGAFGNAIDRLRFGAVVDFLDFHALEWHFWAFNVADAAISLGAAGLLLHSLLADRLSGRPAELK